MLRAALIAASFGAAAVMATAANAADEAPVSAPRIFVHAGPAGIILDEGAVIKAEGEVVPGATIRIKPEVTFVVEAGLYLTPHWAVSFTGGIPPEADVEAAGSMQGMGRVGKVLYGPSALTAHYHFTRFGRFQPYVGAGPVFMLVFRDHDGLLSNLRAAGNVGFAGQAGFDYVINDHWTAFVDAKKAYLRTHATGQLGPAPVRAAIRMDPLVLHGGIGLRF